MSCTRRIYIYICANNDNKITRYTEGIKWTELEMNFRVTARFIILFSTES